MGHQLSWEKFSHTNLETPWCLLHVLETLYWRHLTLAVAEEHSDCRHGYKYAPQ